MSTSIRISRKAIEAVAWRVDSTEYLPDWGEDILEVRYRGNRYTVKVKTDGDYLHAKEGDYIVMDDGDFYVFSAEDFHIRYEVNDT